MNNKDMDKNNIIKEFSAVIHQHEGINGAYVVIPFDIKEVYGAKRVKVLATFDGVEYQGSIVSMGGRYLLGITRKIRKEIGKEFGDSVLVTVQKDESKRVVALPDDFETILKGSNEAFSFWNDLSYSNQRKYVDWITSAKKVETRTNRIEKAVIMLENKTKR